MKITPLYDRICLKNFEEEDNKERNIIIPELAQQKPEISIVTEIGTGGMLDGQPIEFKVKIGDKVLFNKFAGNEFTINNETFTLIKECDILAILEN